MSYLFGRELVRPGIDSWLYDYGTIAARFYVPIDAILHTFVQPEDYEEVMASVFACECGDYDGRKHTHDEAIVALEGDDGAGV